MTMPARVLVGVAVACAAAFQALPAVADGELGLLGGLTRASVADEGRRYEPRYSGAVGAFVVVALPAHLSVRAEAQWMTRGFDYESRSGESHTARYLEVPVLVGWRPLGEDHLLSPYLLLGLSGGVRLHESVEAPSCEGCSGIPELPRLNASVVGGGGLRLGRRLGFFAEARYARGLKKFGWYDGRWDGGDATTRDLQVLAGLTRRW